MGSCGWFPLRRDQIVEWVNRHREELPSTLDELSKYPVPFRRVIVNKVAPEVRVSLWTEHLKSIAVSDESLSANQRAFLSMTLHQLPVLLSMPAPNPTMMKFETAAATLFTREQMARMFGTLGPPEPPEGLPLPADALPDSEN